jgi:hypothetical protein
MINQATNHTSKMAAIASKIIPKIITIPSP